MGRGDVVRTRLCGWLVARGRGSVWCASLGRCCRGPGWAVSPGTAGGCPWGCPLLGPVRWSCGVPCPLRVLFHRGAPGSAGCAWCGPLGLACSPPVAFACRSASVSSSALGIVPLSPFLPWCQCPCVRVVAPAVEGVRGCRQSVRVGWWCRRCTRCTPKWVHPPQPVRGRWLVGVTRCGSCFVGSGLRCLFLAGVCLRGGPPLGPVPWCVDVPWGPRGESRVGAGRRSLSVGWWNDAGFSGPARPPSMGLCTGPCPHSIPFPQRCGPCPFPLPVLMAARWFRAPVMSCPRCACSRGCVPVTLRLSSPLCREPSLCPVPFWCPGGGVVMGPGGRRWPMLGGGWSGATGGGLLGCSGGRGPEPCPEGAFAMLSAA